MKKIMLSAVAIIFAATSVIANVPVKKPKTKPASSTTCPQAQKCPMTKCSEPSKCCK